MTDIPQITKSHRMKPRPAIVVQYAAIRALFLRELQTRFGHYRLGYLWAVLEPGLLVALKLLVFSSLFGRGMVGISYSLFIVAGMLPFFMFMRSATKSLGVVQSNKGLFSYRSVKPIDAVVARTLLELFLYFITFILFLIVLVFFGEKISLSHIPFLFLCWCVFYIFCFGFALVMAVLGDLSEELGKFISSIFVIMLFISGVMFSINSVPEEYHVYLLWNPVLHVLDFIRHAIAPEYPITYVSFEYLFRSAIIMLFIGLLAYRASEKRMLKSK
jgi:capsular polysaccharide transport system permease protein